MFCGIKWAYSSIKSLQSLIQPFFIVLAACQLPLVIILQIPPIIFIAACFCQVSLARLLCNNSDSGC
jgi:hypothetical protein